jgi:hypothetical protein
VLGRKEKSGTFESLPRPPTLTSILVSTAGGAVSDQLIVSQRSSALYPPSASSFGSVIHSLPPSSITTFPELLHLFERDVRTGRCGQDGQHCARDLLNAFSWARRSFGCDFEDGDTEEGWFVSLKSVRDGAPRC